MRVSFLFTLMSLIGSAVLAADQKEKSMDQVFQRLAESYIDESPSLAPSSATTLGDHRFDRQLDEVSAVLQKLW